jgi:hypothetical protein
MHSSILSLLVNSVCRTSANRKTPLIIIILHDSIIICRPLHAWRCLRAAMIDAAAPRLGMTAALALASAGVAECGLRYCWL